MDIEKDQEEQSKSENIQELTEAKDMENLSMDLSIKEGMVEEDILITEDNWQQKTGLSFDTLSGALETMIFMSERPISLGKLRDFIHPTFPLRIVHESLVRLQEEYERAHHGIRLQEVAEGYQFRTKATYSKYISDLFKINSLSLSPVTLEVLAIIAYKQPVSKMDVEKIRGVDSSHIIRALMDKRLVRPTGRSEDLGRPTMYGTTQEFLEVFNLASIHDLPSEHELENLANKNEVGKISDIRSLIRSDHAEFAADELAELDELSENIKSIATDTLFTKTLNDEDKKRVELNSKGQTKKNESEREKGDLGIEEDSHQPKSAFDLLEEFLIKKEIMDQNRLAAQSELLTSIVEPKVGRNEELDLQDALDQVFENLQKDSSLLAEEFEATEEIEDLEVLESRLEQTSQKLLEEARGLNIDLDFFKQDLEDLDKNSN